jgi:hypothetical protein
MQKIPTLYIVAGGVVVAALVYASMRGFGQVGRDIGGAAIDMVDGVVAGAVETIGERIGIPQTNLSKCEVAKAGGRTWDASFDCPAADFIGYLWN